MEETGGVNGEPYGIEANAFTPNQIEGIFVGLVGDKLKPIEKPAEEVEAGRLEKIEGRLERIEEMLRRILEEIAQKENPNG